MKQTREDFMQAGSHFSKAQKETGLLGVRVNMHLYPGYLPDGRGPVLMLGFSDGVLVRRYLFCYTQVPTYILREFSCVSNFR